MTPRAGTAVDALLRAHPVLIPAFIRRGMHCPGCPAGPFHSLEEAAQAHGMDPAAFVAELRAELDAAGQGPTPGR